MDREGYVGIDRNIRRHWMWPRGRAFTELEAWLHVLLFAHALPDGRVIHYQGAEHFVERGQLVTSIHQLGRDWKWDRKKVRRILKRWVKDGSVLVRKLDRHGIHLTICNYETYNPIGTKGGTKTGPSPGPKRDHEITNITSKPITTTSREGPVENDVEDRATGDTECALCDREFETEEELQRHLGSDDHLQRWRRRRAAAAAVEARS